jgi:hypothetical protein
MIHCRRLAGLQLGRQFDRHTGFSLDSNPRGTWSFGSAVEPGDFRPFPFYFLNSDYSTWAPSNTEHYPCVRQNISGRLLQGGGDLIPPETLFLEPGARHASEFQWSVARFTSPEAGALRFRGAYEALALGYGGTQQVIVHGRRRLAEHVLAPSHGEIWEFEVELDAAAGDTVDFLLGPSPNGDNSSDTTGFSVDIAFQPEASRWSWAAWASAVGAALIAVRLRKRFQTHRPGPTAGV